MGAVRLGEFDEVGAVAEFNCHVPFLVEHALPLGDHAEDAVVEDDDGNGDVFDDAAGEFLFGHYEAAVARDVHDRAVWTGGFCADGGGETEAHGA